MPRLFMPRYFGR